MNEHILSFELAKKFKEIGFRWETQLYYENSLTESINEQDGTSGPFGWKADEINLQSGYFINHFGGTDYSNENWYMCSTANQAVFQKWLRETHNIHMILKPFFDSECSDTFGCDVIRRSDGRVIKSERVNSYENALEIGLGNALSLVTLT
jgi:hypothetical protein